MSESTYSTLLGPHALPRRPRFQINDPEDAAQAGPPSLIAERICHKPKASKLTTQGFNIRYAKRPMKKKRRGLSSISGRLDTKSAPSLTSLPLELLGMVAWYLNSRDLLSLARTSRWLALTLTGPDSAYMWRIARQNFRPCPLPDPMPNFTESSYAAFVFDGGECSVCRSPTKAAYRSYALRRRLCNIKACSNSRQGLHITTVDDPLEYARTIVYDENSKLKGWLSRRHGYVYDAEQWARAKEEYEAATADPEALKRLEVAYAQRRRRVDRIVEHAKNLIKWRDTADDSLTLVNCANKYFWHNKCWYDAHSMIIDMANSPTLQQLMRVCNGDCVRIDETIWKRYQSQIIEETQTLEIRRIGRIAQRRQYQHLNELKSYYNWLKFVAPPSTETKTAIYGPPPLASTSHSSGSLHPKRPLLPPLTEFLTLPVVDVLRQKHSTSFDTVRSDLYKPDGVLRKLVQDSVDNWMERTKLRLAKVLGHKHGHYSGPSHPVDWVTALFACRLCGLSPYPRSRPGANGPSDSSSDPIMDTSGKGLTFEALLSHRCSGEWKNEHTLWSVDQFVPDEKAMQAMRAVLAACDIGEDHSHAWRLLDESNTRLMCESCAEDDNRNDNKASAVVLRVSDVIKHAQRHEELKVSLLTPREANRVVKGLDVRPGTVSLLAGKKGSHIIHRKASEKKYGCKHCSLSKRCMSFNGIRSHLKDKHNISRIGDEDFYGVPPKIVVKAPSKTTTSMGGDSMEGVEDLS